MIAVALVDYLAVAPTPDNLLAYYFCDNTTDRRNSLVQVMKSLLWQTLLYARHLGGRDNKGCLLRRF